MKKKRWVGVPTNTIFSTTFRGCWHKTEDTPIPIANVAVYLPLVVVLLVFFLVVIVVYLKCDFYWCSLRKLIKIYYTTLLHLPFAYLLLVPHDVCVFFFAYAGIQDKVRPVCAHACLCCLCLSLWQCLCVCVCVWGINSSAYGPRKK